MPIEDSIVERLGCCCRPSLTTIRSLQTTNHGCLAIRQCDACGSHWIYRCDFYDTYIGPTQVTLWYMLISYHEAAALLSFASIGMESSLPRRAVHVFEYTDPESTPRHRMGSRLPERCWD